MEEQTAMYMLIQRRINARDHIANYKEWHMEEISEFCDTTLELLGDRIDCMVCRLDDGFGTYMADALVGGNGILGIEVASALKTMMPICYKGKSSIIVTDHPNVNDLLNFERTKDGKWQTQDSTFYVTVRGKTYLSQDIITSFEDERYLVVLKRTTVAGNVLMDIYKK